MLSWLWAQVQPPSPDPLPFYAMYTGTVSVLGTVIGLLWKALTRERALRDEQTKEMLPLAIKFVELTPPLVEATEQLLDSLPDQPRRPLRARTR